MNKSEDRMTDLELREDRDRERMVSEWDELLPGTDPDEWDDQ